MDKKHSWPAIIGISCFTAGVTLLLGTLAVWLLAPTFIPQSYDSTATIDRQIIPQQPFPDTPALLPYTPATQDNEIVEALPPSSKLFEDTSAARPNLPTSSTDSGWSLNPNSPDNHPHENAAGGSSDQMHMVIPAIGVDAPILPVTLVTTTADDKRSSQQWTVPDQYAAGWHDSSAPPGQPGNTVINGHNNIYGAVFHDLVDLPLGAEILLVKGDQSLIYQVTGREFLHEQGQPLRTRLRNARWILPTADQRLTLVTCWPNSSNSHRLVVIAQPVHSS